MQQNCSPSKSVIQRQFVETSPLHIAVDKDGDSEFDKDNIEITHFVSKSRCEVKKSLPNCQDVVYNLNSHVSSVISSPSHSSILHIVKKQLTNSMEQCSNVINEIAVPLLLKQRRVPSSKQLQSTSANNVANENTDRDQLDISYRHPIATDSTHPDDDKMEDVENIELSSMNGFVMSSKRESSKGHKFLSVHLRAPTWCDKCGDFIWGVYKQCMKCESKYSIF